MNPSLHPWSPTFLVPCATSVPTLLQVGPHLTMKEQWREYILQPHPHLRIATSHTSKLKSCLFFIFKGHMPYAIYNIYFDISTFPTSFLTFLCYSCGSSNPPKTQGPSASSSEAFPSHPAETLGIFFVGFRGIIKRFKTTRMYVSIAT